MTGPKIGFIGTGIMGLPMAHNLLKAGYALIVHNRTKKKTDSLISAGAHWADSPADVAAVCDYLITCVPDTPDVKEILLGSKGVIESAKPGLLCIDMSTISPTVTRQMAHSLNAKGVTLIDAPVSGGQSGAIDAALSIMVGGLKEAFEKAKPILQHLGRTVTHCGQLGSGQLTKLANQVMVIHTIMSISEGLAFAEKAGLNLQTTLDVTSAGAASSHSLKVLGPKILAGDFKPAFMIDLQQKDLRLVLEYAEQLKQPLPGVALAHQLLMSLQAQGRGRDGTQALIDCIRSLS